MKGMKMGMHKGMCGRYQNAPGSVKKPTEKPVAPCQHNWKPLMFSHNDSFSGSFRCTKCHKQVWGTPSD